MADINEQEINDLKTLFNQLKQLICNTSNENCKIYLENWFIQLKDQVDFPFFIKSETEVVQDEAKLNENWQKMINKVKSFEYECIKSIKYNSLENESPLLNKIEKHFDNNNFKDAKELIFNLKNSIEKSLFNNKSIIYLDKTANKNPDLFHKMDKESTMGKLIVITNHYLGSSATTILNNKYEESNIKKTLTKYKLLINCDKDHSTHETFARLTQKESDILKITLDSNYALTNEIIKCKELQRQLFNSISDNQILETSLDLSNLTHLDLSENEIVHIDILLFKDLNHLETLWLCNNKIENIDSNAFSHLVNLKHLSLSNNLLKQIDSNLFKMTSNLTHLFLANNRLENLDSNLLISLKHLIRVNFYKNNLETISSNMFNGLISLKEINLSENKLSRVDPNIFQGLTKLTKINLSHNKISELDSNLFQNLTNLESIYLSNNEITSLNENIFNGLDKLSYVSLQSNKLDSIEKSLFHKLNIHW